MFYLAMLKPLLRIVSLCLLSLLLSACSSNMRNSIGSLKEAITPQATPEIPEDHVRKLPYSASIVTINDRKPILMILAYVDDVRHEKQTVKRLTWIANDGGSITTENGRIIATTGFDQINLDDISDSLHLTPPFPGDTQSWTAIYDWDDYRYNFSAEVTSQVISEERVSTFLWQQDSKLITENIQFLGSNTAIQNTFWVAPDTANNKAFIVKSIQTLGPKMDKVEMLMIRPYVEFK